MWRLHTTATATATEVVRTAAMTTIKDVQLLPLPALVVQLSPVLVLPLFP